MTELAPIWLQERGSIGLNQFVLITNVARWSRSKPILVIFATEKSIPSVY